MWTRLYDIQEAIIQYDTTLYKQWNSAYALARQDQLHTLGMGTIARHPMYNTLMSDRIDMSVIYFLGSVPTSARSDLEKILL